jgi:F-type H+-transporting ATPase subunit gamma
MPSLKAIRTRITSVRSTQKITRAMKLVAAAKLRRAQENILRARPYALKLHELISELALRTEAEDHPLLAVREPRRVKLLVVTSDRGMCGAFNTNILRAAESYMREHAADHEVLSVSVVGRKGRDYLRHRHVEISQYFPGLDVNTALERAKQISDGIIDEFLEANLDKVFLIYNEFKSVMTQRVVVEQLLPIRPEETAGDRQAGEFIFEPNKQALLDRLPQMYVELEVYRALLESVASEFGARMTAMDNATNNAEDMISTLTLQANRARQAGITKELLEVMAGAAGLMK